MAVDFTKFRIAFTERRVGLGIEIILQDQNVFPSAENRVSVSTPPHFDTVKDMLSALGLDCPIWLIGIEQ